jgi:hypothetical protein
MRTLHPSRPDEWTREQVIARHRACAEILKNATLAPGTLISYVREYGNIVLSVRVFRIKEFVAPSADGGPRFVPETLFWWSADPDAKRQVRTLSVRSMRHGYYRLWHVPEPEPPKPSPKLPLPPVSAEPLPAEPMLSPVSADEPLTFLPPKFGDGLQPSTMGQKLLAALERIEQVQREHLAVSRELLAYWKGEGGETRAN